MQNVKNFMKIVYMSALIKAFVFHICILFWQTCSNCKGNTSSLTHTYKCYMYLEYDWDMPKSHTTVSVIYRGHLFAMNENIFVLLHSMNYLLYLFQKIEFPFYHMHI